MLYSLLRISVYLFLKIYNRLAIHYKKKFSFDGSFIIVANHFSYLDPIYISAALPRKLNYMAKKESFNNILSSFFLTRLGAFPVDRSKPDLKAVKTAIRVLKEGNILAIFPQGQRSNEIELSDIKQGAAYFAVKTNTPIIPVYIKGTDKVMPKGQFLIKPEKVEIFIGEPINISDLINVEQGEILNAITDKVRTSINQLIEENNKPSFLGKNITLGQ